MKKLLLILGFCVFQFTNAQIIPIPDANFKKILTTTPNHGYFYATNLAGVGINVDSNSNNQISVQEAANVASLQIYNDTPVANLSGLEFFTNLKSLSIISATLTSFNFPTLVNLESLTINYYFYGGPIEFQTSTLNVLNLDGNVNLKALYAVAGNSSTLNLTNNVNLEDLYLSAGSVSNLDLSGNLNLKMLYLASGNITNLTLAPNNSNLKDINLTVQNSNFNISTGSIYVKNLNCNFVANCAVNLNVFPKLFQFYSIGSGLRFLNTSNNLMLASVNIDGANLTSLDFSANLNLENISVKNSNLQSINIENLQFVRSLSLPQNKLVTLDLGNLFNLQYFDVSDNLLTQLSMKNGIVEDSFSLAGNPNLQSICCDANETIYVQNACNFFDYINTNITTNCSGLSLSTENSEFAENRISIFPNPTSNILNIESKSVIDSISVTDINGRFVATNLFDSNKIDVQNLQSGIYFLKIASDTQIKTLKFVKE